MSNPQINPADIFGLVGGLLNQGQNGSDPLGLGKVFGDLFGDPERQDSTPKAPQKPAAPNAGKVASDVFVAGTSVTDFLKEHFRKEPTASPMKEGLSELLMEMLAEHDGFAYISESKRETLYRATANKWADKILKQDKPAPKAEAPGESAQTPRVTKVTVTAEEIPVAEPEATVTVNPHELVSVEKAPESEAPKAATSSPAIDATVLDITASALHMEKNPGHPDWDICKNQDMACKYNTLGQAMVILKNAGV